MEITTYENAQDAIGSILSVEWLDLVADLVTHERTKCAPCRGKNCPAKNGLAWVPGRVGKCPSRCRRAGTRSDCGGDRQHRLAENVEQIFAAVFDVDHVTSARLREVLERVDAEGLEIVLHSTHTSKPPDDVGVRIIFPLSRPISAVEYAQLRAAVCARLSLPADPSTSDPSRLYYLPSAPAGEPEPWAAHAEGKALDVDSLLREAPAVRAALPNVVPFAEPVEQEPIPIAMDEVRSILLRVSDAPPKEGGRYTVSSRAFIRSILKGEPFRTGHHDDDLQRACAIITGAIPNVSIDAAIEIIRPSLNATVIRDGTSGSLSEDSARVKLERGKERASVFWQKREATTAAMRRVLGREKKTESEHAEDKGPEPTEGDEDPEAWRKNLVVNESEGRIKIVQVPANAAVILAGDPRWRGALRFNEVTKEIELHGGPITAPPTELDTAVANWLASSEFALRLRQHDVAAQIRLVARRQSYDPLKDYLLGLKWDGVARLDTALETYFGVRLTNEEGADIAAAVRAISSKWFLSLVARGLKPGIKVDTVLILEGVEGLFKSQALDALGDPWFARAKIIVGDQNSMMLAASHWLAELAELSALSKADVEQQKQFFSTEVDTFRVPYGRVLERSPRRCVFVGTTNRKDHVRSDTGNRRLWVAACVRPLDVLGIRRDRDQFYAEAVQRLTAGGTVGICDGPQGEHRGEKWWFERGDAVGDVIEREAEDRRSDDGSLGPLLLEWWLRLPVERRPAFLRSHEVARDALGLDNGRVEHRTLIAVGKALIDLGCRRQMRRIAGQPSRIYIPSEEMLATPQVIRAIGERIASAHTAKEKA